MRTIIFFMFFLTLTSGFAQNPRFKFREIHQHGGVTFKAINHITQDEYGFMWLSTTDQGIIRYDSKNFIHYHHNPADTTTLSSNNVLGILVDNNNKLWIATEGGLNLFIRTRNIFKHFNYNSNTIKDNDTIFSISKDIEGNIWLIDRYGVGKLDTVNNTLKRLKSTVHNTPTIVYFDKKNRGWVGAFDGSIFRIDSQRGLLTKVINGPGSPVNTIFVKEDYLYVGFFSNGARKYTTDGKLIKTYMYERNNHSLSKEKVRSILVDSKNNLWIGSYDGLYVESKGKLIRFGRDNHPEIPHNSIFTIYEDKNHNLWFGAWAGGLFYLNYFDNNFISYKYDITTNSLSSNIISSFTELPENLIAVGTETGGLNIFNPDLNSFRNIRLKNNNKDVLNIKSLCTDNNGNLWAGTFKNQYFQINKDLKSYHHFNNKTNTNEPFIRNSAYTLFNGDSLIWIGTTNGEINFYNIETKKMHLFNKLYPKFKLHNNFIRYIYIDSKGILWVGTQLGCEKYNLKTGEQTYFSPLSGSEHKINSSIIYYIKEINNKIWLGSQSNGIIIINPENDSISQFNPDGPIIAKDVYGFEKDCHNRLWITTNDGIFLYEPDLISFRHITLQDGLQGNIFSPQAIYKDSKGRLYFGGTHGFTLIYPEKIMTNIYKPNILFDYALINNKKRLSLFSDNGPNFIKKLNLKPDENNIKIAFTADNYLIPEKNRFKYRLKDIYTEWIDAGNDATATFTNLPSGDYIFEVKASNNDGIWNEKPTQLEIHIATPWYRTTIAYFVYFLFFVFIIIISFNELKARQQLKRAVLIEKIQRENEERLHEMKLKFFTNISHEFRTPLTLITGPVQKLINSEKIIDREKELLSVIERNTNRLLFLINQIMDFRKIDKGRAKLNITAIETVSFTKDLIQSFMSEAEDRSINFSVTSSFEELKIEADKEKLDKIIFNLISNAFKYSPDNSTVSITIADTIPPQKDYKNKITIGSINNDELIVFSITDSGSGMDYEEMQNIFERFMQGKTVKSKGYGIGLSLVKDYVLLHQGEIIVQSTLNKGTCFNILLPRKQTAHRLMKKDNTENKRENRFIAEKTSLNDTYTNKNILIVEDDKDLRNYIVQILEEYYNITTAPDGITALKILETFPVDLIISDVMMSGMNGFELCSTIKSKIGTSHIPIILLTALSSTENKVTGLREGADAYITKPFEDIILVNQINNLIKQREMLRNSYKDELLSGKTIPAGSLDNYFLEKASSIIKDNITNEQFSVEILSQKIGLHRSQLHRKLKQLTNFSTTEYINIIRLKHAIELIKTNKYSLDEIAYKSGFNSHSYFTRNFKKHFNCTPKEFANNLQSKNK
ncbi:MAG: response regulator [Chlorobi bacterium]|nr:response regulator [Chlorobiota bacterium]